MRIETQPYGITSFGDKVTLYSLINKNGMVVNLINYGAVITNIWVPDKNGKIEDVVLGYDTLSKYESNESSYGAFIGRNANRIGKGTFVINGETYVLEKNDGENNLHSGFTRYNKFMYEVKESTDKNSCSIQFSRLSPDMEQGFPGNLTVQVTYTLTEDNEFEITYSAVCDKDTIVNFTNHSYFNLAGHGSGSILDQKVLINADRFTPTDDALITTGEIRDVTGTPMDFRILKPIGQDIHADYIPLKQAHGYDHNYVLNNSDKFVRKAAEKVAELVDETSGRVMEVFTNMPGLQLYTANTLSDPIIGKEGFSYQNYAGVCFETQLFPDACNVPTFQSSLLGAGNIYDHKTIYKFSTR